MKRPGNLCTLWNIQANILHELPELSELPVIRGEAKGGK